MSRPNASTVRSSGRRRIDLPRRRGDHPVSAAAFGGGDLMGSASAEHAPSIWPSSTGRIDQAALAVERWLKSAPDSADAHYFEGTDRLDSA